MSMEATMEEWSIVLPKQNTQLASVLKKVNGLVVQSKKILIGELILSLLEQLDDHLLITYLIQDNKMTDLFEQIVVFAEEHEPDQLAMTIEQVQSCQ